MVKDENGPSLVCPRVWVGSAKDAKDRALLRRLGICAVVNVTPARSVDVSAGCPNYFEGELVYKRIPLFDSKAEDMLGFVDDCVAFMEAQTFHGSVLVHCHRGVSRSAAFAVAYVAKTTAISIAEALATIREARPQAKPNDSFLEQLQKYEEILRERRQAERTRTGRDVEQEQRPQQLQGAVKRRRTMVGPMRGPLSPEKKPQNQLPTPPEQSAAKKKQQQQQIQQQRVVRQPPLHSGEEEGL